MLSRLRCALERGEVASGTSPFERRSRRCGPSALTGRRRARSTGPGGRPKRPRRAPGASRSRRRVDQVPAGHVVRRRGLDLRAPVSTGTKGRETPGGILASSRRRKNMLEHVRRMPRCRTWTESPGTASRSTGAVARDAACMAAPAAVALRETVRQDEPWDGANDRANDAAPVAFSDPVLLAPHAEAFGPLRRGAKRWRARERKRKRRPTRRRKAPRRQARGRIANDIAAKAESAQARAYAELASAEKALAAAKTDEAKARAEERKQKAAAKAGNDDQLETAAAEAKPKLDAAAAAKDAVKAAERGRLPRPKAASEAKLGLEPVSIYISGETQSFTCAQYPQAGAGRGARVRFDDPGSDSIRNPGSRWHACVHGDGAQRRRAALVRGHDRQWRRSQKCARPHHHPEGRARPHRADRIAALLDHHPDEPLSAETNYRTEFVAVLNNHPQGGFITRTPTPNVTFADNDGWGNDRFGPFFQPGRGAPAPNPPQRNGRPQRGYQGGWDSQGDWGNFCIRVGARTLTGGSSSGDDRRVRLPWRRADIHRAASSPDERSEIRV